MKPFDSSSAGKEIRHRFILQWRDGQHVSLSIESQFMSSDLSVNNDETSDAITFHRDQNYGSSQLDPAQKEKHTLNTRVQSLSLYFHNVG